ncbi:AraC family transcriptional regulator [Leisingera daeponensis]|uniref:AraC family transcriptional regulator n=1 Tax=Leisingera daeponensis TaxID=405746 RepID=A0ABS7NL04_9RHOB|nr:AraC family transcriptional regulator [Leisingera daeponensis]MBY6141883.1 AraC family transcriptional regulator [Leisingera daeponensis]
MLTYHRSIWVENADPKGKYSELTLRPESTIRMHAGRNRRAAVATAKLEPSGTNIVAVTSTGHDIEVNDEGSLTIMLPYSGDVSVRVQNRSFHARAGEGLAFTPSRRKTSVKAAQGREFAAFMLKAPVAATDLRRYTPRLLSGNPNFDLKIDAVRSLSDLIRYIMTDLSSQNPVLADTRAAQLVEALMKQHLQSALEVWPTDQYPTLLAPDPHFRRAVDFMRAHHCEPLQLEDIAEAAGISCRKLQRVFRRATGLTVWAYLTSIRMSQARRLLVSGAPVSVTAAAFECGIAHLGRFARQYQNAYGELPSQTLRRAKARVDMPGR